MAESRILLIRHGQTDFNKIGICQGQLLNQGLNVTGKTQAHEFGRAAKRYIEDLPQGSVNLFCSPMSRAKETAEIVLQYCPSNMSKSDIVFDDRLKEGNMGVAQGMTADEWAIDFPSEAAWRAVDKLNNKFPGGESYMDIFDRTKRFVDELPEAVCTIVVTHEMVSKCVRGYHCTYTSLYQMTRLKHEQNCIYDICRNTGDIKKIITNGGYVDLG